MSNHSIARPLLRFILAGLWLSLGFKGVIAQITPFEKSGGMQSATYFEAIDYFKKLDAASPKIQVRTMGLTDAGYPLHLVLVSDNGNFDPETWHRQKKAVLLINNGIHPGEPDGIDASMMLLRNIANRSFRLPANVCLAVIPVYNIGGSLNRGTSSRVNQNGPMEYGFRGNAQNLDLNRDFTKADSRNARSFTQIFHWLNPDILVDNHVSDGADYQYTMTMLTTQADKLGGELGQWLKNRFEPSLFGGMAKKGWEMSPYVDFASTDMNKGMEAFFDSPRYSSGFAALWQTIGFVPETHMLKPFKDRVLSTQAFMEVLIAQTAAQSDDLITLRKKLQEQLKTARSFPLTWTLDTSSHSMVNFKGYEKANSVSRVTNLPRFFYDHNQPFTRAIPFYNHFIGDKIAAAPEYYVIPQGWHKVTELLKLNQVAMTPLKNDTSIEVQVYKITDYKTAAKPYESHYRKSGLVVDTIYQTLRFLKGDFLIPLSQRGNRFLVEMLEPTGDDSYFSWNYFDGVLQQKEGYSDYRWEDVAADFLDKNPAIKTKLENMRRSDAAFAANASAQLNWVYRQSNYYEPGHNRYPVYRILSKK